MTFKTVNRLIVASAVMMLPVTIYNVVDPPPHNADIIWVMILIGWAQIICIGWVFRLAEKKANKPDYRRARGILAPLFKDDPRPSEQIIRDLRDNNDGITHEIAVGIVEGLEDAQAGNVHPIETLWDDIDDD